MARFVDRQREFQELDQILQEPGAHFVIVYGRRRVGKTTLLLEWVQQTGRPTSTGWPAARPPTPAATAWREPCGGGPTPTSTDPEPPRFDSWALLFEQMARMLADRPLILIFDEFPYAVESDPSLPSHLQAAWDHLLKDKPLTLILAGSHIGMMVDLLNYQAPLYGRITAQLPVDPLPFAALADFFPRYPAAERVAAYAVLGGVPAYLERFDDGQSLSANIRRHLFRRAGMFRSEPLVLISDLVRETRTYEAVLRAMATGHHTPAEIAAVTGLTSSNLSPYLARLRDLGLIERRIPATIPPDQRRTTTRSRYHLRDPYLRFYFPLHRAQPGAGGAGADRRPVGAHQRAVPRLRRADRVRGPVPRVDAGPGAGRALPFSPELVGSHWAPRRAGGRRGHQLAGAGDPAGRVQVGGRSGRPRRGPRAGARRRRTSCPARGGGSTTPFSPAPASPTPPAPKRSRSARCW